MNRVPFFYNENDVKEKELTIPPTPLSKGGAEGGGMSAGANGGRVSLCVTKESIYKRGLTWNGSHLPYNSANVDNARALRKNMTPAEKKLWYGFLRNFKYRVLRQRPIDHYIADFYCAKLRLVIEVDGIQHRFQQKEYDKKRTAILMIYGLNIVRFSNDEVMNDFENVCKQIDSIKIRVN